MTTFGKLHIDKAITHGGYAHRDDFISSCILFAHGVTSIERRDPTQKELEDKNILVFDVGSEYDVEKLNFDHHQFTGDKSPTCALSLILQYLDLYESFTECFDWMKQTEYIDVKGHFSFAKEIGCKGKDIQSLLSPIEYEILRLFGELNHIDNGMWIYKMMRNLGTSYVNKAKEFKEVYDYLGVSDEVKIISLDNELNIHVLFYPVSFRWSPFIALDAHVKRLKAQGYNVVAFISKDVRSEGFRLGRINDSTHIDFNLIQNRDGIQFIHSNGFMAITKSLDFYQALECCIQAVTDKN